MPTRCTDRNIRKLVVLRVEVLSASVAMIVPESARLSTGCVRAVNPASVHMLVRGLASGCAAQQYTRNRYGKQ